MASIGDILEVKLSAECLLGCHVGVGALARLGMTQDTMHMFRFSIGQWASLGLERVDVQGMSDAQIDRVFGTTRNVVESTLLSCCRRY